MNKNLLRAAIIGCGAIGPYWGSETESSLFTIFVHPEHQGRGIGRKLYRVLEEILKCQGYALIYAIITSENRDSLAFHRSLGYRAVAELPDSPRLMRK